MQSKIRVQNMTAHKIGMVMPGQVMDLVFQDPKRLDRFRKSASFKARHLVELGANEAPRPMPRAEYPRIEGLDEGSAIQLIERETDLGVLSIWYSEERDRADGDRSKVLEALKKRGAEITRSAPPAPTTTKQGVTGTPFVPGSPAPAVAPTQDDMLRSGAPVSGGPEDTGRSGSPSHEDMLRSGAPPAPQTNPGAPPATSVASEPTLVPPVAPPPQPATQGNPVAPPPPEPTTTRRRG